MLKLRNDDATECQNWENGKTEKMVALNAETENDDGFEHQNWEEMVGLNTKTEKRWWL